ncbi:MAG: hypothetical protein AAGE52_39970 [Myxococcota bacterium]
MEHLDDDKLQRYFDGELTEGEETVMRRAVEESPLEQARIAQLENLGNLIRFSAEETARSVDTEGLFHKIEKGIAAAPNPRLQVIQGAKRKRRTGVAVAATLAIAAAVTLVVLLQPGEGGNVAEHPMDDPRERIAGPTIEDDHPIVEVHRPAGSEVVRIDFGRNTGTHFSVVGDHGQPLAVVWIDEEAP